ncbi:hypothetical protein D9615_005721 [Tricholomella constricta]|uniref:Uncharacterized protein n=1 Tax=Tricholomella constricta TaxID=117010 RepID=A0A8H5HAI8_9AGAR|nr:hypothetical protein D9615_005721 [Tricholomella constricta]
MSDGNGPSTANLGWANVGLGFAFILLNVVLSSSFALGIERSFLTAAVRCVVQLAIVGVLLQQVFETKNPWAVGLIAFALNLLGTFEIIANQSKRRYQYMDPLYPFPSSEQRLQCPSSHLGNLPIPIVGMLCGNTISGITVCVRFLLRELQENRDKVEIYLAFGATRMEASKSMASSVPSLLIPSTAFLINGMGSVIGIIAIPGTMTGAILGGSSVQQAAWLQVIIMFMISASTALACIFSTISVIIITIDGDHRIRTDRIYERKFWMWRVWDRVAAGYLLRSSAL